MKAWLLSLALLVGAVQAAPQQPPRPLSECKDQLPYGAPKGRKQRTLGQCRKAYAVEYDPQAKVPVWVSYVLVPTNSVGCGKRTNAFAVDQSLKKADRASLADYNKSGYDTGHMANNSDMRWDVEAERESFYLTNMAPQLPSFNRGVWKALESTTRSWSVSRLHPLLIYVGPVYGVQDSTIGKNRVVVPHAFYKVIVDIMTGEAQVFLFKHEDGKHAGIETFKSSLPEVQRQTSVTFPMPANVSYPQLWATPTSAAALKATSCPQ
jgi:endonuclease G